MKWNYGCVLRKATVRCCVEEASVFGIQTLAEYVGDHEYMTKFMEMGLDFGPGFHNQKPQLLRK